MVVEPVRAEISWAETRTGGTCSETVPILFTFFLSSQIVGMDPIMWHYTAIGQGQMGECDNELKLLISE